MIETVTFDMQENEGVLVESTCGVYVSKDHTGRPHVHLFEIEENQGITLNENLVLGCQEIRNKLFPDLKMQDIDWRFTMGIHDTDLHIKESNGIVTSIDMDHQIDFGPYFKESIKRYETALQHPDGFESYLCSGHSFYGGRPLSIFPVPIPEHPKGFMFFKYEGAENTRDVVFVDSQKFLDVWRRQTGDINDLAAQFQMSVEQLRKISWASGYDSVLLSSSVEDSLSNIFSHSTANMIDLPEIDYFSKENRIGFSNGRHRLYNAINAGAPFVPVVMSRGNDTQLFLEMAGWQPDSNSLKPINNRSQGQHFQGAETADPIF